MSFSELQTRCHNRWPEIVARLAPVPAMIDAIERGPRKHGFCPVHRGEHGDAFRVFPDFAAVGGAVCNTCGTFQNGFQLLKWLNGWNFAATASAIEAYLGTRAVPAPARRAAPEPGKAPDGPTRERLRTLWQGAHPLGARQSALLRHYLERRGIDKLRPAPPVLRFHPSLAYYADGALAGRHPAMLASVVDAHGKAVGLHRTYLSAEGGKAAVDQPKKILRVAGETIRGGAVRLTEAARTLGVTEGIENALSVLAATGAPVWAATSAALLGAMVLPLNVRHVIVWADRDPPVRQPNGRWSRPGTEAAEKLAARLQAAGRTVEIRYPESGAADAAVDWNDVLREHGAAAFPPVVTDVPPLPSAYELLRQVGA